MTDSDSDDGLSNTVYTFQNQSSTKVHAKGPHINSTRIAGLSFCNNNTLTSMRMNKPQNFTKPRYAASVCDQRSADWREPSISGRSAAGWPYSSQSVYNGRGGSPTTSVRSFRTIDSNVSFVDVVNALKGFTKAELRELHNATASHNCKKSLARSRVEKRRMRNKRKFLKGAWRRSGGESGDLASDSSVSSDDGRSIRSSRTGYRSHASTRTDLTEFRREINESNMYEDCTDKFRQNPLRHFDRGPSNPREYTQHKTGMPTMSLGDRYNSSSMTRKEMSNNISMMRQQERLNNISLMAQREKPNSGSMMTQNELLNSNSTMTHKERWNSNHTVTQKERFNSTSRITQQERFRNGFQLPCQRFQKSTFPVPSTHRIHGQQSVNEDSVLTGRKDINIINQVTIHQGRNSSLEENDDIFAKRTAMQIDDEEPTRKRNLDNDGDQMFSNKKRSKLASPQKQNEKTKPPTPKQTKSIAHDARKSKDFVFLKPQFPIGRLAKAKNVSKNAPNATQPTPQKQASKSPKQNTAKKQKSPKQNTSKNNDKAQSTNTALQPPEIRLSPPQPPEEILISKSTQPLDVAGPTQKSSSLPKQALNLDQSALTQNTTDLSMRPSFIKRKLFTQKVDVPDKNSSSDSLQAESPGSNIYSTVHKEKHKTRKIVASQSCMSRDILGDESNLLDLIHKIVPPDRMNITSATNRSEIVTNKTNNRSQPANKKGSNSSVMTTSKDVDDVSDTFTDEEIFNETVVNGKKETAKNNQDTQTKQNGPVQTFSYPLKRNLEQTNAKSTRELNKNEVTKPPAKNDKKQHKTQTLNTTAREKNSPAKKNGDNNITKPLNQNHGLKQVLSKPVDVSNCVPPNNKQSPGETPAFVGFTHNEIIRKCVKSFWDSDFESDFELERKSPRKSIELRRAETEPPKVVPELSKQTCNDSSKLDKEQKQVLGGKVPIVSIPKTSQVPSVSTNPKASNKLGQGKTDKRVEKANTQAKDEKNPKTQSSKTKKSEVRRDKTEEDITKTKPHKTNLSEKENAKPDNTQIQVQNKNRKDTPQPQKKKQTLNASNKVLSNKNKILKVNNNTIRFKSYQKKEAEKSMNESSDSHYLLRSREVLLSSSFNSTTSTVKKVEKPVIKKSATANEINVNKHLDKSKMSDPPFSLALDSTPPRRKSLPRKTKGIVSKTRKSDVSFTLLSDKTIAAARNSRLGSKLNVSREVAGLLNMSTRLMTVKSKRTPIRPIRYVVY